MFSESRAFGRYWKGKLVTGVFPASKLNHRKMIRWHQPRRWHYREAPGFSETWKMKVEPGKIQESFFPRVAIRPNRFFPHRQWWALGQPPQKLTIVFNKRGELLSHLKVRVSVPSAQVVTCAHPCTRILACDYASHLPLTDKHVISDLGVRFRRVLLGDFQRWGGTLHVDDLLVYSSFPPRTRRGEGWARRSFASLFTRLSFQTLFSVPGYWLICASVDCALRADFPFLS